MNELEKFIKKQDFKSTDLSPDEILTLSEFDYNKDSILKAKYIKNN